MTSHARIQNRRDSEPVDEWFCGTCFTPWPCAEASSLPLSEAELEYWRDSTFHADALALRLLATIEARDDEIEVLRADLTAAQEAAKHWDTTDLEAERDGLAERLEKADAALKAEREHQKGIVQGGSPREIAEAIIAEHDANKPQGAHADRSDDELCRVCALANMLLATLVSKEAGK